MFHNYYFLKRLSQQLHEELVGYRLGECFSQNKDELILGFASAEEQRYIQANLSPQISLLHSSRDYKRAKKNSVDLFPQLTDQPVSAVRQFQYERSFAIHFANGLALIFKMHASRSNILLVREQTVLDIFRHQLPRDMEIQPGDLHKHPDLSREAFEKVDGQLSVFLPALGKEVKHYLKDRGYEQLPTSGRWSLLQQTLHELETNPVFIYLRDKPALTLLKEDHVPALETTNALEAASRYYELYTREYYLSSQKEKAVKTVNAQIRKTESYLDKTTRKLEEISTQRSYEELANIIMANLHQLNTGTGEVRLYDFYNDQEITLKLKPELSPQKNAENYYRKSKNHKIELQKLEENIENRKNQLKKLNVELAAIMATEDFKSLRKQYNEKKTKTEDPHLPYHKLSYRGYDILVGKNAKHNDQLTLKVANKDDLWLHAKDVAGSHVVIRHQAGKSFPKDVMERAAELAAWFSKRKTDSLCPVIYTPKKFIRKPKGSAPGAVIVEKEEVMMVEPKGF